MEATSVSGDDSVEVNNPMMFNFRLLVENDADTCARKARELRDETTTLRVEIERCDRGRDEIIVIAVKAFELSRSLRKKWFDADDDAKRRILDTLCLN